MGKWFGNHRRPFKICINSSSILSKRQTSVPGNRGCLGYLIHVVSTGVQVDSLFSNMAYLAKRIWFLRQFLQFLNLPGLTEVSTENFFFMFIKQSSVFILGVSFASLPEGSDSFYEVLTGVFKVMWGEGGGGGLLFVLTVRESGYNEKTSF